MHEHKRVCQPAGPQHCFEPFELAFVHAFRRRFSVQADEKRITVAECIMGRAPKPAEISRFSRSTNRDFQGHEKSAPARR